MKKKLLPVVLGVAVLSCGAVAFAACGESKTSYTVTFDANGGVFAENTKIVNSSVAENTSAKQPETPERSGYELLGWATDEDGKEMWDFRAYSVYENTTLYAVWVKTYTVTLNANGGSIAVDGSSKSTVAFNVHTDSLVTIEYDITKSGSILTGWTTDAEGTKKWNIENDDVTEDVTLYAVWKNKYNVTFEAGKEGTFKNGKTSVTVDAAEGESVAEIEIPEREGYDFIGWSNNGIAWSEAEPVTGSLTVTALWQLADNAQLPSITVVRRGNNYSWAAVKGAEGYSVVVKHFNNETGETETYREKLTTTSWTFPATFPEEEVTLTKGDSYYITVIAHGDGIKTLSSSASITYAYKVLDKVTGLIFNTTTGELRWDAVANANEYLVMIDDNEEMLWTPSVNYINLNGKNISVGSHNISVMPRHYYGDYISPAASGITVVNKILPAPENFRTGCEVGCVRLSWDEVLGADGYIVSVGENSFTAEAPYYDFDDETLFENGTAKVTVQAFNSDGFYLMSDKSNETTVKYMYTLSVSRYEKLWCDYTVKKTNSYGDIYVPNTYTVTLSGIRWTLNDSITMRSTVLVSPVQPLQYQYAESTSNYIFVGWYKDSEYTEPYDFTEPVESDLTLYAKYYYKNSTMDPIDFFRLGRTSEDRVLSFSFGGVGIEGRYFSVFVDGEYTLNFTFESGNKYLTVENITNDRSYISNQTFSGNSYSYTFKAAAGDVIYFRVSKMGSGAMDTTEKVKVYLEGNVPEDGGRASGYKALGTNVTTAVHKTVSSYGTKLTITADDREDETFVGWYIGDECVSTEKTYSFTVDKNIALVAKYE